MRRLEAYKKDLYELRFSPMCKPAGEVANLTQLESHTTRARMMMLWRIAEGILNWGPREVELLYESTLDSISEAFDVFHYPIWKYMLDARADVWDAGLAPGCVKQAVEASQTRNVVHPPIVSPDAVLLLAGEIAQLGDDALLAALRNALQNAGIAVSDWIVPTGALAYALGAQNVARFQATRVIAGIAASGAQMVITDGPETAWALLKIYPALGLNLPANVTIKLLSAALDERLTPTKQNLGKVFVHDSRPAYLIADCPPSHTAILPGYMEDETAFGRGAVYDAPRHLLDALGAQRVSGIWTRALAKTSGADDGLWLTYPDLAAGLAAQRLDYAEGLGATMLVTDSPLAAAFLAKHAVGRRIRVKLLAELLS
ncbi:MAG: hypothetical protein ACUVR2_11895 [Anaerolineae bacterium]